MEFQESQFKVVHEKDGSFSFEFILEDKGPLPVAPAGAKFTVEGKAISYDNGQLKVSGSVVAVKPVVSTIVEPQIPVAPKA